jgi:hypothetical protein
MRQFFLPDVKFCDSKSNIELTYNIQQQEIESRVLFMISKKGNWIVNVPFSQFAKVFTGTTKRTVFASGAGVVVMTVWSNAIAASDLPC